MNPPRTPGIKPGKLSLEALGYYGVNLSTLEEIGQFNSFRIKINQNLNIDIFTSLHPPIRP